MGNAFNSLSNKELIALSKQGGILICRYYIENHKQEYLFDNPEERFGVKPIMENVPYSVIEAGALSPDTEDEFIKIYMEMDNEIPTGSTDVKLRSPNGEYRWYHADYTLIYDCNDKVSHALITFYDNTERREMEFAVGKWQASLRSILEIASLYAECNLTKNLINTVEGKSEDKSEYHNIKVFDDLVNLTLPEGLQIAEREEYYEFFSRTRLIGLMNEGVSEDGFEYCLKKGDVDYWITVRVSMIRYPSSDDIIAGISFVPTSEKHRDLEALSHKAYHDALTGLLNREGIEIESCDLIENYDPKNCVALFMIDLDNFKQINDKLGHQVGDLVLKKAAETLEKSFRSCDIIGRLGGDEFIVMISGDVSKRFLERKATEIISSMKLEYGEEKQIQISASIGIAYGRAKITFEKLYRISDVALYSAKKAGKCCFHIINADTNTEKSYLNTQEGGDLLTLQAILAKTEETNSKNLSPYEALIENIPGGVVVIEVIDDDVKIDHCNDWPYKFLGYEKEELHELQKETPLATVHPDDIGLIKEEIIKLRAGSDNVNIIYRLLCRDGTYKYVALNGSVTERRNDRLLVYSIHTDVNEMMTKKNSDI